MGEIKSDSLIQCLLDGEFLKKVNNLVINNCVRVLFLCWESWLIQRNMSQSVQAAITKYHRWDSLNNRHLLSHCSGGWKSEIKSEPGSWHGWVWVRTLSLACRQPPSFWVFTRGQGSGREREGGARTLVSLLLIKPQSYKIWVSPFMTSFNFNYLPTALSPDSIRWGIWTLSYEWAGEVCVIQSSAIILVYVMTTAYTA